MTIWLTRPEADSVALAETLSAQNIQSCIAPVMRIATITPDMVAFAPNAILITSRHALHALTYAWYALPVFCVGSATAEGARAMGCSDVRGGDGDLLQLLPIITANLKPGARLLYLSGEDIQIDPAPLLATHAIQVARQVVYEAVAEATLPGTLRMQLADGSITGIVLFSARSATLACQLLREEKLDGAAAHIDAYCLSLAVAQAAGALPWRSLQVSHVPTREALLAMLIAHIARIAS